MKIWTTLTGAYDVAVHTSSKAAVDHLVGFLNGCGAETEATPENWRAVLAEINADMDASGEAGYLANLAEHDLPAPRLVVEEGEHGIHAVHSDSPLMADVEVVALRSDFDAGDHDASEIMEITQDGGRAREFVGSRLEVQTGSWDVPSSFEAMDAKDAPNSPAP